MNATYHIINMYRLVTGSSVYVPLTRAETKKTQQWMKGMNIDLSIIILLGKLLMLLQKEKRELFTKRLQQQSLKPRDDRTKYFTYTNTGFFACLLKKFYVN